MERRLIDRRPTRQDHMLAFSCRNVAAGVSSGFDDLALLTGNVPVAFGATAFAIGFQTAAQGFMFFGIY
jgi:hypothetical protein